MKSLILAAIAVYNFTGPVIETPAFLPHGGATSGAMTLPAPE